LVSYARYRFFSRGAGVDIDHRAVIDGSRYIALGSGIFLQRGAWLSVPLFDLKNVEPRPYLRIGDDTRIGANCTIAAVTQVDIGRGVLFGPNVLVVDHAHAYDDVNLPVSSQGVESNGGIVIEDNCWLGANSIIYSANGPLRIGRNSVVAGNSFVREDVPPYTVVAGNPAKPVRQYDFESRAWRTVTQKDQPRG